MKPADHPTPSPAAPSVDEETIDRLLHDAEHKDSAATFARDLMRQPLKAREFEAQRDGLIAEAKHRDPHRRAEAWLNTSLSAAVIDHA